MSRRRPDPSAIRDFLPGVLRGMKGIGDKKLVRVRAVWPEIVGEAAAARTRLRKVEGGRLTVDVASAALKQDLTVFRSDAVLEGLGRLLPDLRISEVRYRVSALS